MQPLFVFVAVTILACVRGEDECLPMSKPGDKLPPVTMCCNVEKNIPPGMRSAAQKCIGTMPKPSGPPPSGGMPKEMLNHHTCMAQCIFNENKLIKDDKTVNEAAVKTFFTSSDKDLMPVLEAAVPKCLASYKSKIDKTLNCTSGAAELEECFLREILTNCPNSAWTSNADCDKLKAKVTKCPNLPLFAGVMSSK